MRKSKINVVSCVVLLMSFGFALPVLPVVVRVPPTDDGAEEHWVPSKATSVPRPAG